MPTELTGEHSTNDLVNPWQETLTLAHYTGQQRWVIPLMIVLGLAAALAETLSIGLSVLFLFALLDQGDELRSGDGLLSELYNRTEAIIGTDPSLIAIVFFALILLNALLVYANHVMTATMLNHIAERVRNRIHHQYVNVGYLFLQKREHGELIHTLATESWTVSEAFYSLARIGVNLCTVVVFGIGLFALSWVIGIVTLVCAFAVIGLLRILSRPVHRLGRKTLAANQILAERMLVSLNGMRTLRVFAKEDFILNAFESVSLRVRQLAVRTELVKSLIGPIGEVASLGTLIIIAIVAAKSGVSIPTIIASVLLLFRLQPHLSEIEANRLALAGMSASLRNVREILEMDDKPWPREGALKFPGFKNEIRFANVSFSHDPRRGPSLGSVSFSIRCGETTMIAGASGSGKTTILNMILRLYEPDSGEITVDGVDIGQFTRKSWLSALAIAGQDVELIDGTVAQNIRLGNQDSSDDAVREVCRMVEILDDIESMPDGFDTSIGAAGLNFSGGQRQRIGLARALLCDPKILILDEAMSALEPDREDRIRHRIDVKMEGLTVIVVSHRSNPSIHADATVFIKCGEMDELGDIAAS